MAALIAATTLLANFSTCGEHHRPNDRALCAGLVHGWFQCLEIGQGWPAAGSDWACMLDLAHRLTLHTDPPCEPALCSSSSLRAGRRSTTIAWFRCRWYHSPRREYGPTKSPCLPLVALSKYISDGTNISASKQNSLDVIITVHQQTGCS